MGNRMQIAGPGSRLGHWQVEPGSYGIATVCSVTINGIFLAQGIPATSRFGGLLQMSGSKPVRFAPDHKLRRHHPGPLGDFS